jgi:hypothetical protein
MLWLQERILAKWVVDAITPKESALRSKIKFIVTELYPAEQAIGIFFPGSLMETFFSVKPKLTIKELQHWLQPFGYDSRKKQTNLSIERYNNLLKREADLRIEFTTKIIRSRLELEEYNPYHDIELMKETYIHNQQIIEKLSDVNNQSDDAIAFRRSEEEHSKTLESMNEILKKHQKLHTRDTSKIKKKVDQIKRLITISTQQWASDHEREKNAV